MMHETSHAKMDEFTAHDPTPFLPLLDHLGSSAAVADGEWRDWHITCVAGAGNNLLFRATGGAHDLAIKFTIRDARDRAGREYDALRALQQAGLAIAPVPLWLDRHRYAQPVVVQSWLEGTVLVVPPAGDDEWQCLLDHYLAIHTLTPASGIVLPQAVLNMHSAADGLARIRQQLAYMPALEQPAALHELIRNVEAARLPDWPTPPSALCRVDPNTLNFVRQPNAWASVDWENAGWGDPAYEIADLITHPAYLDVPPERLEWLIDAYCASCGDDSSAATRLRVYRLLMLIWWVARLARTLYEVPRGGDRRLVERPEGWLDEMRAKYERYLALGRAAVF
jgi:thiamine kinase-like enzyme